MNKQDLRYLGAIRTPQHSTSRVSPKDNVAPDGRLVDGTNYSGGPFCIDFTRREFALVTRHGRVLRLKMVRPEMPRHRATGDTTLLDFASVPVAAYVDGVAADISNNTWGEVNNPDADHGAAQEGLQVIGDYVFGTGSIYYDAGATQDRSVFLAKWPVVDPLKPVERTPWRSVKGLAEGVVAGPAAMIPEKWRTALRGDIITGQSGGLPIISRQSRGPCAVALWAKDLLTEQDVNATFLLGFVDGKAMPGGEWGGPANDLFNNSTTINSITFVGDNVVFVGNHGYGEPCYGDGTGDPSKVGPGVCYDPTGGAKGTHAYPYRVQAWIYAAQDLADVAAGTKLPHQLTCRWFSLDFPTFGHQYYKPDPAYPPFLPRIDVVGADYDSEAGELYVAVKAQDSYGYEPGPLVHVWAVDGVERYPNPRPPVLTTTPPVEPPPPPPELDRLREEVRVLQAQLVAHVESNRQAHADLAVAGARIGTLEEQLLQAADNLAREEAAHAETKRKAGEAARPPQFPGRDLVRILFNELNARYKRRGYPDRGDGLHVDDEGLFVWLSEFMRHYAVDHPDKPGPERHAAAVAAVLDDIDAEWQKNR